MNAPQLALALPCPDPLTALGAAIRDGRAYHLFDSGGRYLGQSFFFPDSARRYRDSFMPDATVRYLTNTVTL